MKCRICGRKISDPSSMRVGIGPVCYKAIYGDIEADEPEEEVRYIPIPGQMSINDYMEVDNGQTYKME